MPDSKKVVSRELRVTIIVEEVEAPAMDDAPNSKEYWKSEVEEFIDEADYSRS
ncbi:MAG: hypothetical protein WBA62_19105 [Xanthobacteraceae bacterium]